MGREGRRHMRQWLIVGESVAAGGLGMAAPRCTDTMHPSKKVKVSRREKKEALLKF